MEHIQVTLDAEKFDKAVHGGLDTPDQPVLREGGDLAIYVKPDATAGGRPAAVLTFTVEAPDGKYCRAQCVTTVANLINALAILRGWESGGHLNREKMN